MRNPQLQRQLVKVIIGIVSVALVISTVGCGAKRNTAVTQFSAPPTSTQAAVNRALTELAQKSPPIAADYQIGPQDTLQITLFNVPTSEVGVTPRTAEVLVSQNGNISLPLLGDIRVVGLTTLAVEQELRLRYATYIHEPQVGVLVKEYRSRRVSVIGAVNHPGVLTLTGPKTLVDVLALAGGVTEKASGQVHLSRQGPHGREDYLFDLQTLTENAASHHVLVQAEDVVNVSKAGLFFVYGAINKPGSYPLDRPYRLTQALAIAGGTDDMLAKLSDVTIIRTRATKQRETLTVNLKDILSETMPDPVLESDDVVVIPVSTPKLVVKRILDTVGMGLSFPVR